MYIDVSLYPNVEAAFEAARTTGFPCYFKPGDHNADGLTVPSGVALVGAGYPSRITGHITFVGNTGKSICDLRFGGKVTLSGTRFIEWRNIRFEDQLEMVPSVRVPGQSAAFCHYNRFYACWFRGVTSGTGIVNPVVSYGQNNFNSFDGCQFVPDPNSTLGGISILPDPIGGTPAADGWTVVQCGVEAGLDGAYQPFLNISGRGHNFQNLWLELKHVPEVTWVDNVGVRFNADSRHCVLERSVLGSQFGAYPNQGIHRVQNLGRFNHIQDKRLDRDLWDDGGIVPPTGYPNWVTKDAFETAGGTIPPEPNHFGG